MEGPQPIMLFEKYSYRSNKVVTRCLLRAVLEDLGSTPGDAIRIYNELASKV